MLIYLLKETDHGLLGAFKSMESIINHLKENWNLSDDYEIEEYGLNSYITDNRISDDSYFFTVSAIILHD